MLASLGIEAVVGYPQRLHARVPHPVVWAGRAIDWCERTWNLPRHDWFSRRMLGCMTVVLVGGVAFLLGYGVERAAGDSLAGLVIVAVIGTVGLAQRSLYEHVRAVLSALQNETLDAARQNVARIVGRDTTQLDESGVSAAALESLAESFNDGIVAPAFWFVVAGLPGLFVYKALNTADSLIGHRETRWRDFGWAAARSDDIANLVPARLAGLLLMVAGGRGLRVMWRDASKHASPNAGWPEAAMAGALRLQLGGPAAYDGVTHERPTFGTGKRPLTSDLARGLRLYLRACAVLWAIVAIAGVLWPR